MHESYSRCFYAEKVGRRRFGTHDGEGILMIRAGDGDGAFLNSSLRRRLVESDTPDSVTEGLVDTSRRALRLEQTANTTAERIQTLC